MRQRAPHTKRSRHSKRSRLGFTIVEVMVVLAIAGVLLLIVFLLVPAAQRNARNHSRKHYAGLISSAMETFLSDHKNYPADGLLGTGDGRCSFMQQYLDISAPCGNSGDCVTETDKAYTICFHNKSGGHEYPTDDKTDEFSIELGHSCNPDTTSSDYIVSTDLNDANFHKYVVWTQLEQAPAFCIDNGYKN